MYLFVFPVAVKVLVEMFENYVFILQCSFIQSDLLI